MATTRMPVAINSSRNVKPPFFFNRHLLFIAIFLNHFKNSRKINPHLLEKLRSGGNTIYKSIHYFPEISRQEAYLTHPVSDTGEAVPGINAIIKPNKAPMTILTQGLLFSGLSFYQQKTLRLTAGFFADRGRRLH